MGAETSRQGGVELPFTMGQTERRQAPPLHIAILADFGAQKERAIPVRATQGLDEVMQAMASELDLFLEPSPIESAPPLHVRLKFHSMTALSPAGLIA